MIPFWISFFYAVFLILYASFGFYKTGSLMSLYSGTVFGSLLLVFCYGMKKNLKWGKNGALILTAFLTVIFTVRSIATHKPVPILLGFLSVVVFTILKMSKPRISKEI